MSERHHPWSPLVRQVDEQLGDLEAARIRYQDAVSAVVKTVEQLWRAPGWAAPMADPEVILKGFDPGKVGTSAAVANFRADWGEIRVWTWMARGYGGPANTLRIGVDGDPDGMPPKDQGRRRMTEFASTFDDEVVGDAPDLVAMPDLLSAGALWLRVVSLTVADLDHASLRSAVLAASGALVQQVIAPASEDASRFAAPLRVGRTALIRVRAWLAHLLSEADWDVGPEGELLEDWHGTWVLNLKDADGDDHAWVGLDRGRRTVYAGTGEDDDGVLAGLSTPNCPIEEDFKGNVRVNLLSLDDAEAAQIEEAAKGAFRAWLNAAGAAIDEVHT